VSEWKLLDETRIEKKPDAFMTRADIAHLLYRTIITAMHRTATGDIPAFNEDLAVQYEDRKVEFSGLEEAAAFEKLYENGKEYRNERLGFSLLLPKTMPTYMCDYQKPATLVEVNAVEKGNDVYIGPAWYEENEYLGEDDGVKSIQVYLPMWKNDVDTAEMKKLPSKSTNWRFLVQKEFEEKEKQK
jgi:hypothetical protein